MKVEVDVEEYIEMLKKKHLTVVLEQRTKIDELQNTIVVLQANLARYYNF